MARPSAQEARHWLTAIESARGRDQLEACGLDAFKRREWRRKGISQQSIREVWRLFSLTFCPSNLSSEFHYNTWGRFNPDMRNSYKLLALKWLNRKSKTGKMAVASSIEHNRHWASKGHNTGALPISFTSKPWTRHVKRVPAYLDPVAGLPLLTG